MNIQLNSVNTAIFEKKQIRQKIGLYMVFLMTYESDNYKKYYKNVKNLATLFLFIVFQ